jgi:XTP/dITP diphosphohydrolase
LHQEIPIRLVCWSIADLVPPKLLLATKNTKKVREMREILGSRAEFEIVCASDFPEIPEPEETGNTFMENAQLKAIYYASRTGLLALADDSGLEVDALGGRPGVASARYADTDSARISKLLRELSEVGPAAKRSARFVCAMALARVGTILAQSSGTLEGVIATESRGTNGFGYDPIFFAAELNCHLAEAPPETKNRISHRGRALSAILPELLSTAASTEPGHNS